MLSLHTYLDGGSAGFIVFSVGFAHIPLSGYVIVNTRVLTIISVFVTKINAIYRGNIDILRVRSHDRRNELMSTWDFKPTWNQVLFTWRFISVAFQNESIWWTCIGISFRLMFTWCFITQNKISFLSKWPQWNIKRNEFQRHMHINPLMPGSNCYHQALKG